MPPLPPPERPPIGTVIRSQPDPAGWIRAMAPHGFECWQLAWSLRAVPAVPDLDVAGPAILEALDETGTFLSALGVYGNPLLPDAAGEAARDGIRRAVAFASRAGVPVVGCFAGRVPGTPVPGSIPRFREVFSGLAAFAEDHGVRLAFENCLQGGTWESGERNIAINPDAWELLFDAVPSPALALEWEPAHQICQGLDPLPQLDRWTPRIAHIHGKDGQVRPAGPDPAVYHRFPGFGDTSWEAVIAALLRSGYNGTIDIEGGHDPVLRDDRETEGQVRALHHLRTARRNSVETRTDPDTLRTSSPRV